MPRKDADLIVSAAYATGTEVRLAGAMRSRLADAEAAGHGAQDYTTILEYVPSSRSAQQPSGSSSVSTAPSTRGDHRNCPAPVQANRTLDPRSGPSDVFAGHRLIDEVMALAL